MRLTVLMLLSTSLIYAGCNGNNVPSDCLDAPAGVIFEDGFEAGSVGAIVEGETAWTQAWSQNGGDFELVDDSVEGGQSMRFFGPGGDADLVKSLAEAKGLCMSKGDELTLSVSYLIPSGPSLAEVFLADIECQSCGGQNPGPRLQLKETEGLLRFDRGKFNKSNLGLAEQGLPRDAWFRLKWTLLIGDENVGRSTVSIDGVPFLEVEGQTTSRDYHLDNFQVGLTASASPDPVEIFVDDVVLERVPGS